MGCRSSSERSRPSQCVGGYRRHHPNPSSPSSALKNWHDSQQSLLIAPWSQTTPHPPAHGLAPLLRTGMSNAPARAPPVFPHVPQCLPRSWDRVLPAFGVCVYVYIPRGLAPVADSAPSDRPSAVYWQRDDRSASRQGPHPTYLMCHHSQYPLSPFVLYG